MKDWRPPSHDQNDYQKRCKLMTFTRSVFVGTFYIDRHYPPNFRRLAGDF